MRAGQGRGHKDQKRRRRQNPHRALSAAPHLVSARSHYAPAKPLPIAEISRKAAGAMMSSSLYNIPIERPSAARHERLWRHDRLYDVFFELGMNDAPPEKGAAVRFFCIWRKTISARHWAVLRSIMRLWGFCCATPRPTPILKLPKNFSCKPRQSLAPKSAVPTRIWVAPRASAVSKSPDMPMDK